MSRKSELFKNTAILFLGKISTQFISFFLLPLYTYKLSAEEYGYVDLILTYVTLATPLLVLELEMATFRYLIDAREDEEKKKTIIDNVIKIYFFICIFYSLLFLIFCEFVTIKYKYLIIPTIVFSLFSNLFLQIARGVGKNGKYTVGCIIAGLSNALINLLLILKFNFHADSILVANSISNLLCIIYLFNSLNIKKYFCNSKINLAVIKELLKYSWPLVPNSICWWVINASDRTIVTFFMGAAANGIYSISTKFSSIISSIFNIFGLSLTESASLHIKDKDRDEFFSSIIDGVIKFFSSICLLIIAIMPLIFNILIGEAYREAYMYIPINIISAFFNCLVGVYSSIYIALKETKKVAKTSLISAIINITIDLLFIKYIGIYAASISTAVAFLTMSVIRKYDLKKYMNIKYDKKCNIFLIFITILVLVLYYRNNIICNILNIIIVLIAGMAVNKNNIRNILEIIKNRLKKYHN